MRPLARVGTVLIFGILLYGQQKPEPPPKPPEFPAPPASARVWKSLTTGQEYRVWIENERLRAEWINVPPELAQRGAYTKTECRRAGTRWIGVAQSYRPCETTESGKVVRNWCRVSTKIEFDRVEATRMLGRTEAIHRFDCANCRVLEAVWVNFEWAPKETAPIPIPTRK